MLRFDQGLDRRGPFAFCELMIIFASSSKPLHTRTMGVGYTEEDCAIQDRLGKKYRVQVFEKPDTWCLMVYDGDVPVGYANCLVKVDVLTLDDLHVSADATLPGHGLPLLLRNLFHYRARSVNYRSRGLGTAMLRLLIARASNHGFKVVEACLSPHDMAEDPTLPEWYCRRGFTLVPAGDHGRAKVQLQVRRGTSETSSRAFAS